LKFYSQHGQDEFVLNNFFRGKRGGVFVDVGAYDGETYSNTLFFERSMDWKGLCIEPLPSAFAKLKLIRRAICEQVCVSDFEGEAEFVEADAGPDERMLSGLWDAFDPRHVARLEEKASRQTRRRVPVTRLSTLLEKHKLFDIDYCSIDTEGSEFAILSGLDFTKFRIGVLTVECNYEGDARLPDLLTAKGYDYVGRREQDMIFKRREVKRLPQISVLCAVIEHSAERDFLLAGLQSNLASQTVAVEPIYVFDQGEKPPPWLGGQAFSVAERLSPYQAWNVALSVVASPAVMTLDAADRLAPDAAETLERELWSKDAIAAAGDWKICATQAERHAVEPCYAIERLPLAVKGSGGRLGSAAETFDTLGPCALWRTEAHMRAPRYPWRFRDGSRLTVAGDAAWLRTLVQNERRRIIRVQMVIGHCRPPSVGEAELAERTLFADPGIAPL